MPTAKCGQLFCHLGCVCGMPNTKNQSKVTLEERCSRAECMLQCICGYQQDNPSSRRCFASLMIGNTSFNSNINLSASESQSHEKRVNEYLSEYHIEEQNKEDDSVERFRSMEKKRQELDDNLDKIKQKLNYLMLDKIHPTKTKHQTVAHLITLTEPRPLISEKFSSFSQRSKDSILSSTIKPFVTQLPQATNSSEKCIFPNVVTAEIISVQSNGNATLKIILEEMTDRSRELCRVSIVLPLHKIDDRCVLVALDHIPKCGFQIPGLSVFIPGDVLGRAASAATERKVGVFFPFRSQLKNSESIFKAECGVYGIPQLTRHVFVGPFPSKHFENCSLQSCVVPISLTKPVPSDFSFSNASSLLETSTEPKQSAETAQADVSVPAEEKDKQSNGALSEQNLAVVFPTKNPTPESNFPEENKSQIAADGVESNKMQTANKTSAPPSSQSVEVPLPKPRKFAARVHGLPATTLEVFPDKVLIKHPFNHGEVVNFDYVDNAKCWLQSINKRQRATTSNSTDDSNFNVGDQNENRVEEKTARLKRTNSTNRSIEYRSNYQKVNCINFIQLDLRNKTFFFQKYHKVLGNLLRDLDAQLGPNRGNRQKVVILENVNEFAFLIFLD